MLARTVNVAVAVTGDSRDFNPRGRQWLLLPGLPGCLELGRSRHPRWLQNKEELLRTGRASAIGLYP